MIAPQSSNANGLLKLQYCVYYSGIQRCPYSVVRQRKTNRPNQRDHYTPATIHEQEIHNDCPKQIITYNDKYMQSIVIGQRLRFYCCKTHLQMGLLIFRQTTFDGRHNANCSQCHCPVIRKGCRGLSAFYGNETGARIAVDSIDLSMCCNTIMAC